MPSNPAPRRSPATTLAAIAGVAMLAAGIAVTSPEPLIEKSFSRAMASTPGAGGSPEAGTEAYWLSKDWGPSPAEGRLERVLWSAPVAAGDRIVLGSGNRERTLEILSVRPIEPQTTRIETTPETPLKVEVKARDRAVPDGDIVRFEIETRTPGSDSGHSL